MLLRWQKLLDSSTYILNFIDTLDALFSREICCVVIAGVKFRSFGSVVIWKGRAFLFSVKWRTCPFLKRLKSVKESNNTEKTGLTFRKKAKRSDSVGQLRLCVCCFKTQFGNLNWMDNNRKHFYCAAEKGKDVANAGWGIPSRSVPSPWRKELNFVNSLLAVWHETTRRYKQRKSCRPMTS